jgi:hypothetical protein
MDSFQTNRYLSTRRSYGRTADRTCKTKMATREKHNYTKIKAGVHRSGGSEFSDQDVHEDDYDDDMGPMVPMEIDDDATERSSGRRSYPDNCGWVGRSVLVALIALIPLAIGFSS